MKAKLENGEIMIYRQLPNTYGNVQNGYASLTERHEADGFLDLITPELSENEILGEVYQVENYFTYHKIYVEPKTPEEIAEIQRTILLERLQNYSIDLRIRAKASAIDKKGSRDYIFAQVEMYELKYKIAKGIVSGQYFTDLLTNESVEFGLSIEDFKSLIITMYETSEATYQQFLFMIERCRTFIQTLIENNDFTKVDSAFALIDTLDAPEQAQSLMASILEL